MNYNTTHLIPMTQFIDGLCELLKQDEISYEEFTYKVVEYQDITTQDITLGQFIPCDLDGNVLEEPKETDFVFEEHHELVGSPKEYDGEAFIDALKEYQEAEKRVLFKKCKYNNDGTFKLNNHSTYIIKDFFRIYNTLEDIVHLNLELC